MIMKNYDYENINDNIVRFVAELSKKTSKITEGLNVIASAKALLTLAEVLNNIPDDVKKTRFYEKVQRLKDKNLCQAFLIMSRND